jgi:hypothetical protein
VKHPLGMLRWLYWETNDAKTLAKMAIMNTHPVQNLLRAGSYQVGDFLVLEMWSVHVQDDSLQTIL